MRATIFCFLVLTVAGYSCNRHTEHKNEKSNELEVTTRGDTVEVGFWTYSPNAAGLSSSGEYRDGFKLGNWIYATHTDSTVIDWDTVRLEDMKFNLPGNFERRDSRDPVVFLADVDDGDDNTYFAVLRYDLSKTDASVFDYLHQSRESWENDSLEQLVHCEIKKYAFRNVDVFSVSVEFKNDKAYRALSYVFLVDDFLYDISYKNNKESMDQIQEEVLRNILYSFQCQGKDLFNFYSKQYTKEEEVSFKETSAVRSL